MISESKYTEALRSGDASIAIWGLGHLGYSVMCHYGREGIRCIGIDVSKDLVNRINSGELPIPHMKYWLGFDPKNLFEAGVLHATSNWQEIQYPRLVVHFICVPTEKDGKPDLEPLEDVINKICQNVTGNSDLPVMLIIESTLYPGATDEIVIPLLERKNLTVGRDILICLAPRRDWFVSNGYSLTNLPRVIGGTNGEGSVAAKSVLSIICQNIEIASDYRHAEACKSIENAYRHLSIAFAMQLSHAFPHLDMQEIGRLIGTKWNQEAYYPSFGVGGYCIPLASQYLLDFAPNSNALSLIKDTIITDEKQAEYVVDYLLRRSVTSVGILGLAYKENLKISELSPTIKLCSLLTSKGILVKVNDPWFSDEEIMAECHVGTFNFPHDLCQFDAILLSTQHQEYISLPLDELLSYLGDCSLVLDNTGAWTRLNNTHIDYRVVGSAFWLR